MKRYEAYKDSGTPWIGEIPSHWKLMKNKYLFKRSKEIVFRNSSDYKVLSLTMKGVIPRDIESNLGKMPASFDTYQIVHPDTLLLCLFDIDVTPRCVGYVSEVGIVSPAYTSIKVISKTVFTKFFYYWFLALDMDKRLLHLSKNLRNSIGIDEFMALPSALPTINEQIAIVNFLERKIIQIDAIISKKQELIDRLKEYRQSLISETVTKGIDKSVPMRDCDIPWIQEIPKHWRFYRLKFLVNILGGGTPSRERADFWGGDIPWVSPKDMKVDIIEGTEEKITEEGLQGSSAILIPASSVLVVVRSGILKHSLPVAINKVSVSLNQDMKAFIPNNTVNSEYLSWLLKGMTSQILFTCKKDGATVDSIEMEDFKNMLLPIPQIDEQIKIINYLNQKTRLIDGLIERSVSQIEDLQQYRQSLICEVVTGKWDVRDYVRKEEEAFV